MKNIKKSLYTGIIIKGIILFIYPFIMGCSADVVDNPEKFDKNDIKFNAFVDRTNQLNTKALIPEYVTSDPFDSNFYVEMVTKDPTLRSDVSTIGTYKVADGFDGRLTSIENGNPLQWQTFYWDHSFWSWTLPWLDEYENYSDTDPKTEQDPPLKTVPVIFHDSFETGESSYETYKNNSIYETFIGTQQGPVSFAGNGPEVALYYRHLVSQIRVDLLVLIQTDITQAEHLQAEMTFYGMPKEATFYPHPSDSDDNFPYVKANPGQENSEVTYYIANKADEGESQDFFYICPEVDFSDMKFKITIKTDDPEYDGSKDFFGDFANVEFVRTGEDWDNTGSELGNDTKILHAGELMSLVIYLYPGEGPGIGVKIENWYVDDPKTSTHHPKPGIYTDSEAEELANVFTGTTEQDKIDEFFKLYGEKNDNENIFNLYGNVTVNRNNFPLSIDYILEGNGYLISMKSNSNKVTLGNMRNVYISDGKKMIYIDEEGNIFLVNMTTFEKTSAGSKISYEKDSYSINLTTGVVDG